MTLVKPPVSTLDPRILSNLHSYDEYLSYYIQLSQTTDTVSWMKADLLAHMAQTLGETSVEKLADDIKQPRSTVTNYIRTSRAFPIEKRNEAMSFSHHFQASFSDEFDEKTKTFKGEKRFEWVNTAQDDHLSTRQLAEKIHVEKKKEALGEELLYCMHCGGNQGVIKRWVLYSPGARRQAVRADLHEDCYLLIVDFMYEYERKHRKQLGEDTKSTTGDKTVRD